MFIANEIMTVDQVLDDPLYLVNLAKQIEYFAKSEPILGIKIKLDPANVPPGNWRGFRSNTLDQIDSELYQTLRQKILSCIFPKQDSSSLQVEIYLHLAPASITYDPKWWHTDPNCEIAGVVYLNEVLPIDLDCGTRVVDKNKNEIIMQNKFNRLIAYRSSFMHRPSACFGDNIDNTRLTLTFFIAFNKRSNNSNISM